MDESGKKMGRPLIGDEPKDKRISVRVTQTTVDKFQYCVDKLGKSKTNVLEEWVERTYNELKSNS